MMQKPSARLDRSSELIFIHEDDQGEDPDYFPPESRNRGKRQQVSNDQNLILEGEHEEALQITLGYDLAQNRKKKRPGVSNDAITNLGSENGKPQQKDLPKLATKAPRKHAITITKASPSQRKQSPKSRTASIPRPTSHNATSEEPPDLDDEPSQQQPYTLASLHSKGTAMIATRPLVPGTEILTEPVLLSLRLPAYIDTADFFTREALGYSNYISTAVERLLKSELRKFRLLEDHGEDDVGRVRFNCFDGETVGGEGRLNIYEKICRINHSCVPNAAVYHPPGGDVAVVRAIKQVEEGEEITMCYLMRSGFDGREQRRKELESRYKFLCKCVACYGVGTRGRKWIAESEKRRMCCEVLEDLLERNYPPTGEKKRIAMVAEDTGRIVERREKRRGSDVEVELPTKYDLASKAAWYVDMLREEGIRDDRWLCALYMAAYFSEQLGEMAELQSLSFLGEAMAAERVCYGGPYEAYDEYRNTANATKARWDMIQGELAEE